jgi:hypothetical protein
MPWSKKPDPVTRCRMPRFDAGPADTLTGRSTTLT